MSLYGALAENTRRNERIERGFVTVPSTGVATIRLGPGTATVNITGPMRFMTAWQLQIDDGGSVQSGIVGASAAAVTGSLNTAGTILTLHTTSFTSSSNPTLIAATTSTKVWYEIWGTLNATGF